MQPVWLAWGCSAPKGVMLADSACNIHEKVKSVQAEQQAFPSSGSPQLLKYGLTRLPIMLKLALALPAAASLEYCTMSGPGKHLSYCKPESEGSQSHTQAPQKADSAVTETELYLAAASQVLAQASL